MAMRRSIQKLRGSLVPAILAAACVLGLLMYHGSPEGGRSVRGDARDGSAPSDGLADRLAETARPVAWVRAPESPTL